MIIIIMNSMIIIMKTWAGSVPAKQRRSFGQLVASLAGHPVHRLQVQHLHLLHTQQLHLCLLHNLHRPIQPHLQFHPSLQLAETA